MAADSRRPQHSAALSTSKSSCSELPEFGLRWPSTGKGARQALRFELKFKRKLKRSSSNSAAQETKARTRNPPRVVPLPGKSRADEHCLTVHFLSNNPSLCY